MDHQIDGIGKVSDCQIGELVMKLRVYRGLSIAQLAVRVGVNPSLLSEVERGLRLPNDEMVRNLAVYFSLDENTLFEIAGRVPLTIREELESQTMLQKVLKEITKVKLPEQRKQEIYHEFLQVVQRISYSA